MKVTITCGLSFDVKLDDGKLRVYPTPSSEQFAEVKAKALEMYRERLATLETLGTSGEDTGMELVAIAALNFMEKIHCIRRAERTCEGTPYSFLVTFNGCCPTIEIFCKEKYVGKGKCGDIQYRNVLKESLRIFETALGYDLGGPTGWNVSYSKYTGDKEETVHATFDNGSETVGAVRDFVNSYCRI